MKIKDLIKKIEKDYPLKSAYDFDNTGANIVDSNIEITGIITCLDVTFDIIDKAKKEKCNLIISHHPLIFTATKRINDDINSKKIKTIIKNNLNVYSIHTNFDVNIKNGMGQLVLYKLFDKNEIAKHSFIENILIDKNKYAIGDIVTLKKPLDFADVVKRVIRNLNVSMDKASLYEAKQHQKIKKLVIVPGSGKSEVEYVLREHPDCFITSDLAHNNILDLCESGISYIGATHEGMEKHFADYMSKYFKKHGVKKIVCG